MKRHAPATARNSAAIAKVLHEELPNTGAVLEVASGSGEHAIYLAREFPALTWQPTDVEPEALGSIAAWAQDAGLPNIAPPLQLDAAAHPWPVGSVDAIFCCNMIHISPWAATQGLFRGAADALTDGPLILYGPFEETDVETAPSNLAFHQSLQSRNPEWGLRLSADLDALAANVGLQRTARYAMPANNLILVYRRAG